MIVAHLSSQNSIVSLSGCMLAKLVARHAKKYQYFVSNMILQPQQCYIEGHINTSQPQRRQVLPTRPSNMTAGCEVIDLCWIDEIEKVISRRPETCFDTLDLLIWRWVERDLSFEHAMIYIYIS